MNRFVLIAVAAGLVVSSGILRRAIAGSTAADQVTRVSCIGDSITFGSGTKTPKTDSYAAQLGRMLGDTYTVTNFGVSGATLLNHGDHPYQKSSSMRRALNSKPDIVIIMLGTNDTKPQNWKFKDEFVADYQDMIGQFRNLDSHPKIFICLPPFVGKDGNYGINEAGVEDQIPLIRKLATDENVTLIDNYTPLKDHPDLLPDNVHPNKDGAAYLAKSVFAAITGKVSEGEVPPATQKSR